MKLFPAIDIKDGSCVRLYKGDFGKKTVYHKNPEVMAKKWQDLGATYLHIVDLDGALDGKWTNEECLKAIIKSITIPVQTGGGIRTLDDIKKRLDIGVDRVIIGTKAVQDMDFVRKAIEQFGTSHIAIGIDAKNGYIATHGWEVTSEKEALSFAKELKEIGVTTIIYTDISKDGTLSGPNFEETKKMIQETGMQIIASGGVSTIEDLDRLVQIESYGAIIGKALYTDAIALDEAVERFERS